MKKLETPNPRYGSYPKKETIITWKNFLTVISVIALLICNLRLINNSEIPPWKLDHHIWPKQVGLFVLAFVIALFIQQTKWRITLIIIVVLMCLELHNYYPISLSIGILLAFIFREIYNKNIGQFIQTQKNTHR